MESGIQLPGELADDSSTDRRQRRLLASRAFRAIKAEQAAQRTPLAAAADRLNDAAASSTFFSLHVVWFLAWILWNTGHFARFGLQPFDPYPFGFLTLVVSLEAIFLSIFVLMAQKREAATAELREEMSLQVSLRLEQEVTKTLQLVAGLYTRMGHKVGEDPELQEMLQPLDIAGMERELLLQIQAATRARRSARR